MTTLAVEIRHVPAMQVISFYGFGPTPELQAWHKLTQWVGEHEDFTSTRIFGFNNPSPSPGSPNYGYEFWLVVDPELAARKGWQTLHFSGGMYAVTDCVGAENIGPTWQALAGWCERSDYAFGEHQWLEENLSPLAEPIVEDELHLVLYLPIAD